MLASASLLWIVLPFAFNAAASRLDERYGQLMARQDCQLCAPDLLCCNDFTITLDPSPFTDPIPVVTIPIGTSCVEFMN
jgi:hypothetical protein